MNNYDWRDKIKVGDILYEGARINKPRIVRAISHKKNGQLNCVTFSILRCSWTERAYTILNRSDLETRNFLPSGYKAKLKSRLDKRIDFAIKDWDDRSRLKCCDVVGICR